MKKLLKNRNFNIFLFLILISLIASFNILKSFSFFQIYLKLFYYFTNYIHLILLSTTLGLLSFLLIEKKKIFQGLVIIFFWFFLTFYGRQLFEWIGSFGIDTFDATKVTTFQEIFFYLSTLSDFLFYSSTYLNIFILSFLVSSMLFVLNLLFVRNSNFKLKLIYFLYSLIFIFLFMIFLKFNSFLISPKKLHEQVKLNFDNDINLDANFDNNINGIIYIGESTSSLNFSSYGYFRETTPNLKLLEKKLNLFKFDVLSTHTHTGPSLLEAFSLELVDEKSLEENNLKTIYETKSLSLIEILLTAKKNIQMYSNSFGNFEYSIIFDKIKNLKFNNNKKKVKDLEFFENNLKKAELDELKNTLILLHSYAGHGPYLEHIPENERSKIDDYYSNLEIVDIFGNTYFKGDNLAKNIDLIESYDTTIKYIDKSISKIISIISKLNQPYYFIYFADHGESVYTNRGHESSRFVYEMLTVPFFIYFNDAFINEYPNKYNQIKEIYNKKKISTLKNLSPTILHLHDIEIKNSTINSEIIGNTSVDKLPPILKRNTFNGRKHISLKNKKYKNSKNFSSNAIHNIYLTNKFKEKKFCYHRSNTVGKILRGIHSSNCIEIDIIFKNNKFNVAHLEDEINNLSLDKVFDILPSNEKNIKSVWLDGKNIDNVKNCEALHDALDKFKKKINFYIEFPRGTNFKNIKLYNCAKRIKENGNNIMLMLKDLSSCKDNNNDYCQNYIPNLSLTKYSNVIDYLSFNYDQKKYVEEMLGHTKFKFATWNNNITNLNENIFLNSYEKIDIIITDSKDDPNSINYE